MNAEDSTPSEVKDYEKLYCKRKYYGCISLFMSLQGDRSEEKILKVEKELKITKEIFDKYQKRSVNDILIMLNLLSSK